MFNVSFRLLVHHRCFSIVLKKILQVSPKEEDMPTTTIDLSSDFNGLYNRILRYLRLSSALRQQSAFVVMPEHMKATAAQQLLASTFARWDNPRVCKYRQEQP